MKTLQRVFRKVTLKRGSNVFLDSPVDVFLPERSRDTDIQFSDVIKGKELDVLAALETHNVMAELRENEDGTETWYDIYTVDKDQEDFDLGDDQIYFLITKDDKTEFEATAVFVVSFPNVKVKINGSGIHQEVAFKTTLEELDVPEKKKQYIQSATSNGNGGVTRHSPTRKAVLVLNGKTRLLKFYEDTILSTISGERLKFEKGSSYTVGDVNKKRVELAEHEFTRKQIRKHLGRVLG